LKDVIGNKLEEGDLVQVALGNGVTLRGHVKKLTSGGIIGGVSKGKHDVSPGVVTVTVDVEAESDPRSGVCPHVLALRDPEAEATLIN
jgi:hypothetical protein